MQRVRVYAALRRVHYARCSACKAHALLACAQLNMVLDDITSTANTAANMAANMAANTAASTATTSRTASKMHGKDDVQDGYALAAP